MAFFLMSSLWQTFPLQTQSRGVGNYDPRARKTGHARPISILFSLIRAVNFKRIMNEIITDVLE